MQFREFIFDDIFQHIEQGARLKKADHIKGSIPFVMSGITNTGVVGFIGNQNAKMFQANSITIDIFGNTFYRKYDFAASDDVGVFWTNNKQFDKNVMLFLTAIISHSLKGKFTFGFKLRSSQTHQFVIQLPTQNNAIDFDFMHTFIRAIEKIVIKEVVEWADKKIQATKQIINRA